ncbi:MAG: ATP-grasp domain-containing protein [bacterium]
MKPKNKVLIAGIGGASLGTEILKCLLLTGRYQVFGCDISEFAYGHYQEGFNKTFLATPHDYIESVLEICSKADVDFIVPGGEEPMALLSTSANIFTDKGIHLAINSPAIIENFSNKKTTFEILSQLGFQLPLTKVVTEISDLDEMPFPSIVKPATGSGGSSFVFLAANKTEAAIYTQYLLKNGKTPLIQEYIPEDEGEFTVGVLSLPNKELVCSIALKRVFNVKLSISSKTKSGLISSGYSQGLIDDFPEVRMIAEKIAAAIQSSGPLNIQGRLKNGVLIPFELNPRFSASTYLRAMAGINEVDIYLQYVATGHIEKPLEIRKGYYFRSLTEVCVDKGKIKND